MKSLGNYALQMVFLELTGFRFPFAHFITRQAQASELYTLFWGAVDKLSVYGFTTAYVNMDGAQSNRSFMHMHGIKLSSTNLHVTSPVNPGQTVIFTMDYSHVIKKIRNNIMKSGIKRGRTRNLELPDKNNIQWQMWVDAFNWDKTSPLQIHRALTQVHVYPNAMEKMRNHLAEEVLNDDMLNLMTQYQASLSGSIDLLKMIQNFHDQRPISQANDMRLHENMEILHWFKRWEETIAISDDTSTAKSKKLLSRQCIEDLYACILGFDQLCRKAISMSWHITPAQINSDVVENEFCQQRATYNGPNSHPNALQYRRNLNNIILGQSSLSRKGNAATKRANATSYAFNNPQPLRKKTRKSIHSQITELKPIRL
ncbi:hypothetical protein ACJMK2_013473 [Sinanodonta woodiana]|uniref:Transposase n=1 Tax=Sinanodonta woodiana TaxID=1069815 RepID=A0ABD3UXM0_SINWO